jgi:hypothetical protein
MGTTTNYGFEYLDPTDPPDLAGTLQNLAEDLESELRSRAFPRMRVQKYATAGVFTYTPSDVDPLLKGVWVELVSGGGAGGGAGPTTSPEASAGGGGQGGRYARFWVPASDLTATVTVTVGAGGVPVSGGNGGTGGTTSFGGYGSIAGGAGGTFQAAGTSFARSNGGSTFSGFSGTASIVQFVNGADGDLSYRFNDTDCMAGRGGESYYSGAGREPNAANGDSFPGLGHGAGGTGCRVNGTSAAFPGGAGAAGLVMIYEVY